MKQFNVVFNFELMNYLKRKSYIIVTIVLVAVVAVFMAVPFLMGSGGASASGGEAPELTKVAFYDQTGEADLDLLNSNMAKSGFELVPVSEEGDTLKSDVENGTYDSAVVLSDPLAYTRYVQNKSVYDTFGDAFNSALKDNYTVNELVSYGATEQEALAVADPDVTSNVVITETGSDQTQTIVFTYVLTIILYMAIIIYGQFVASSVATEKSSRTMELLITSADPKNLIFGKVFGTGLAGLIQFAAIIGTGLVVYQVNRASYAGTFMEAIFDIPPDVIAYMAVFFVLGFFLYAFIYAALGSLVSRMEDLPTATQPVTFIFIAAYMIVMISMGSGQVDNAAMTVCSFIPFTSPMAMFTRIAMGNVPGWQIGLSIGILAVSVFGIGLLATGIYRLGVLMYGKPPKLNEVFKLLKAKQGN